MSKVVGSSAQSMKKMIVAPPTKPLWVVPINQRWGIDLVGVGAECLILFCCVGIAGLARKYANTRTSDYWPTIVFFISVVVAIFFVLAIVNVTFVRIGWWR